MLCSGDCTEPRTCALSQCPALSECAAGDDLLSRLVNAAIGFKPLYALMKVGAKHVLQSTAERNGVPWRATARQLQDTPEARPARARLQLYIHPACAPSLFQTLQGSLVQIRELRAELEDPTVHYPDYYVQPFHAYEEGNLNWLAAFEVESATYSMALRTFPSQGLSPDQAQRRLRDGIHGALRVRLPLCVCCRCSRGPCGSSSWSHYCL